MYRHTAVSVMLACCACAIIPWEDEMCFACVVSTENAMLTQLGVLSLHPQTEPATQRTTSPPSPRPCLKLCPAQSLGVNSLSSYSQRQAEAWAPVVATAVEVVMVVEVML